MNYAQLADMIDRMQAAEDQGDLTLARQLALEALELLDRLEGC